MSNQAYFSCTALKGTNKTGNLRSDKNGYYRVVLGAFDFLNSAGENYPFKPIEHLFNDDSSLIRKIKKGLCRGELGHPTRSPGMKLYEYIKRILSIEEKCVSHHIKSLFIDKNAVKNSDNKPIIAVLGDVKPCGPYGYTLEESIKNPDENVAFSLRSLVERGFVNGVVQKFIKILVTYDLVNEGGIGVADKYHSPSLEEISDGTILTPKCFSKENFPSNIITVGNEEIDIDIIKTELGWSLTEIVKPTSLNW